MPPSGERARLDASLTSECPELRPLAETDGAAVTRKLVEIGRAYNDCRNKHRRLVEAVQDQPTKETER